MHKKFIKFFVDPKTNEPFDLIIKESKGDIIISGLFKSSSNEYPIVRGIPRFIDFKNKNYADSFSFEWHKWGRIQFESENVGKPMAGQTRKLWERVTGINNQDLQGKTILDIGCGAGRFIEVAREKGADVIGLDLSEAVEEANNNFIEDSNVCICQANAMMLPFSKNSIDAAFSIGVLHHTPHPKTGLTQAFNVVNSGGWVAISVYSKGSRYDNPITHIWRGLFKLLYPLFKHRPALIYTYFIVYLSRMIAWFPALRKTVKFFFPNCFLPDINWSLLDTFDRITPSYQSGHESYEIFMWFKSIGFINIEPTNWGYTSYKGFKP